MPVYPNVTNRENLKGFNEILYWIGKGKALPVTAVEAQRVVKRTGSHIF
jgi:hypothetical protein